MKKLGKILSLLLKEGIKLDKNLPIEYFEFKFIDQKL